MWVLPTRGRPKSLERFIEAWKATSASTRVMVRLDSDDPELVNYIQLALEANFTCNVGPRRGVSKSMNEVFEIYPDEPWYGLPIVSLPS